MAITDNTRAIMLDLETLSTRTDAVVLSAGAVYFNPFSDYIDPDTVVDVRVNADEQIARGRHVQDDTIAWWSKQPQAVQNAAFGDEGRVSVADFLQDLNRFVLRHKNCDIWCQGPVFDIVILENLYRQWDKPAPWNYWQIRDSRTAFGMHGDPRDKKRDGYHNALEDSIAQAQALQKVYHEFVAKPVS